MRLTSIREQIKAILEGVSGIGVVHDYQRWSATWEKFLDHFKDPDGKINGWVFTREKTPATCESATHESRVHSFKIRGYYGLKDEDATELTFQDLIENISAAFRAKRTLNSTAEDSGPFQVDLVEPRLFGSVLCHYCELTLEVEEFENWS